MPVMTQFEWNPDVNPELACWMFEKNAQGWFVSGMGVPTHDGKIAFTFVLHSDADPSMIDQEGKGL